MFSSLDLAMAYHQVQVAPHDVEKTAFITHCGLFEMDKMPFGLCNAPSTYQRLMSIVLQRLIGRICLANLDDVMVFRSVWATISTTFVKCSSAFAMLILS